MKLFPLLRLPLFDIALVLLLVLLAFGRAYAQAPAAAYTVYLPLVRTSGLSTTEQVLQATNALRAQAGCPALTLAPALTQAAQGHSDDMAAHDQLSHAATDGSTPQQRAQHAGYAGIAGWENIAAGYQTPAAAVAGWEASSDHRANMLNCALTQIGIGVAENDASAYRFYWTQAFGRPE